jgi:hypothetical protein
VISASATNVRIANQRVQVASIHFATSALKQGVQNAINVMFVQILNSTKILSSIRVAKNVPTSHDAGQKMKQNF